MSELLPVPEDWTKALAVAAHPDDMEYGAASAVARWASQGKEVAYTLVTRGEAGIASLHPDEVGHLRMAEQQAACDTVGAVSLEFLDHADGLVTYGLELRRDLAAAIRRHRPEVLISGSFRESWGGYSWNHADHRALGPALLDAARDAGNPWLFPEAGEAWDGVRFALFAASPRSTHGVDVSDHLDMGVASLTCHSVYLEHLGEDAPDPDQMLRGFAASAGPRLGVEYAVPFEFFEL